MELTLKQKTAFGIGAVGKDMVYALSASYVMYYYQDVLGLSASFVGVVLMAARFFDAFNDPFMGVLVAKTRHPLGTVSVRGSFPARCSMRWCSTPCLPPRCWTKRR